MLPIYAKTSNQGFFPSLFNDFFNDSWITPQFHSTSPAINVSEDDKGYTVEIAAPGMTKEDFNVSISDGDIVIAMEKKNDTKDENGVPVDYDAICRHGAANNVIAVIVESCHMDNATDIEFIKTEAALSAMAEQEAIGIMEFLTKYYVKQ